MLSTFLRASLVTLVAVLGLLPAGSSAADPAGQRDTDLRVVISHPSPGSVLNGKVIVSGWAVDPTSRDGPGVNPRDIQLWLGPPGTGYLLDYAQYGQPSPEAVQFYGPVSQEAGFAQVWDTCSFPPSNQELYAFVSSLVRPGVLDFTKVDVSLAPCAPGTELFRADWGSLPPLIAEQSEQFQVGDAWAVRRLRPGAAGRGIEGLYCDFLAEITAQKVGREDGFYFFDFRVLPGPGDTLTDSFYRFSIHPASGRYRLGLARPGPDPIEDLITWTESPAIRRGNEPNRLGVAVKGPQLRLYANGELVVDLTNDVFPWGKIRFGAATGDDFTTEVHFRDFVITTLPAQ
jgi:hypothetical protein